MKEHNILKILENTEGAAYGNVTNYISQKKVVCVHCFDKSVEFPKTCRILWSDKVTRDLIYVGYDFTISVSLHFK